MKCDKWNSESRMRENRMSGLMRGGTQAVIGRIPSQSAGSCLLYTDPFSFRLVSGVAKGLKNCQRQEAGSR